MLRTKKTPNKFSKIYGFIHIGVMNGWQEIIEDEMRSIHNSGLFAATNTIFVGISGEKVLIPFGTKLAIHNPELEEGENETIKFLHQKSKEIEDANFWYIHTKGASKPVETDEAINAESWRKYMQFFVIENWQDCIEALKTYDACGVEWAASEWNQTYIFSGNFWWATSSYLSKIKDPLVDFDPYGEKRFKAEFFISLANPLVKTFHSIEPMTGNLYGKYINQSQYQK